jgi:hypothetical protein
MLRLVGPCVDRAHLDRRVDGVILEVAAIVAAADRRSEGVASLSLDGSHNFVALIGRRVASG